MFRSSRSLVSRITTRPKSALVGSALILGTAGMAIGLNPATATAAPAPTPKAVAQKLIPDATEFACFSNIVDHESDWNISASNPSSGAYGLVQALPGGKMASAGADWQTNPATQIKWGLDYMNERYGSPCGAWSSWQDKGWY